MKTKLLLITLLTLLFSPFTQAENAPVPKKIISITAQDGMNVLGFYGKNKNYKTVYTKKSFMDEFCVNNPEFFKKRGCTEKAFKFLPIKKTWFFPALPEAKADKTVKWVYANNEILRINFAQAACKEQKTKPRLFKECITKALQKLKKIKNPQIVALPETYIIPSQSADTVTIDNLKFEKSKNGLYYRLTQILKKDEISLGLAIKAAATAGNIQEGDTLPNTHATEPNAYIKALIPNKESKQQHTVLQPKKDPPTPQEENKK